MGKSMVEMAAEIVQSQCCTNSMSSEEISVSLVRTYETLSRLSAGSLGEEDTAAGQTGTEVETKDVSAAVPEKTGRVKKAAEKKNESRARKKTAIPASPEQSIQQDRIICMECGKSFTILSSKHLQTHGLSSRDYREKYGFTLRQPLCSKALSEKRKKAGQEKGAPENLLKAIAKKKKSGQAKK